MPRARDVIARLQAEPLIEPSLVVDPTRPTTRKMRFVSEHFSTHLLRADWEQAGPVSAALEGELIARALAAMPRVGAVVLSDYAKGVLTPRVVARSDRGGEQRARMPVIVDPKAADYAVYRGATVITPNREELADCDAARLRRRCRDRSRRPKSLPASSSARPCVVTRSEEGMSLYAKGEDAGACAGLCGEGARRVGRGRHGGGDPRRDARDSAPTTRPRCAPPMRPPPSWSASPEPRRSASTSCAIACCRRRRPRSRTRSCSTARCSTQRLAEWRRQRLRIGFTNGCFDLLHRGHIRLMAAARSACDRLVVGLNSDASVTRLKGKGRPIQDVTSRAEVLAALEAVDLVVVFEEDTPLELIRQVRPAVLVKGGDYARERCRRPRRRRGRRRRGDPGRSGAGPQHEQHGGAVGRLRQNRHLSLSGGGGQACRG